MQTNIAGEITVGGVFLRLYIANPGWVLRKPKEFITELLENWSHLVSANSFNVSTVYSRLYGNENLLNNTDVIIPTY